FPVRPIFPYSPATVPYAPRADMLSIETEIARPKTQAGPHPSPWNYSRGKRLFDLSLASVLLLAAVPLMVLVAFLVRLSSRGPALFCQTRSGQDGRGFQIMKFRTMTFDPSGSGA